MFRSFGKARIPLTALVRTLSDKAPVSFEHLEAKLKDELATTYLHLKDVSSCNCGQKFEALIVSPKFEGKSLLAQQRLVMAVLEEEMKIIHSFAQKTLTPKQWQSLQAELGGSDTSAKPLKMPLDKKS